MTPESRSSNGSIFGDENGDAVAENGDAVADFGDGSVFGAVSENGPEP